MMKSGCISIIAMTALGCAATAHSAERVTLRNGFAMECSHHAEADGKVRLFNGKGEDSYLELRTDEIAGYEEVPDAPKTAAAADTSESAPAMKPETNARLTREDLGEILNKASREHNVDVDLLASLVKAESGGNPRAVSRTGARGLMQLMPGTAAELGVKDSFEPADNVRGGTAYLDALLTSYHNNLALALAAYNAGPGAVAKYHGIPPYSETRAYVARVIHEFNRRVKVRQALAAAVGTR
jgi:soluble lytic murein transglycosylase-like protein